MSRDQPIPGYFLHRLLLFVFRVCRIFRTVMECNRVLSHDCSEVFWLPQLWSWGSRIGICEHVIFWAKNMATVYQCVRCKGLFQDINAVTRHECRSLTQPKDPKISNHGTNQPKNSNRPNSNANGKREIASDHDRLQTSQQMNSSATNLSTGNQEKRHK